MAHIPKALTGTKVDFPLLRRSNPTAAPDAADTRERVLTAIGAIARTGYRGALALLFAAGSVHAAPFVLAQGTTGPTARPSNQARQEDQYLGVVKQLRSHCESAAWTLWQSNSYESWRNRKSYIFNMQYMTGSYPSLPAVPQDWSAPDRTKLETSVKRANDVLKESGATFKELADYINAKDYEDDKFKKGDELNAKLLAFGRTCHELSSEMTGLYSDIASRLIEQRKANAVKPEIVAAMITDWQKARILSQELARHQSADPAKLDALVKEISSLVEDRKANFEPLKQNPDSALKRFYEGILNDNIAVKMRRYLRDAKSPKAFKEAAEDRPRSNFWGVRSEIDVAMPGEILRYIQSGK